MPKYLTRVIVISCVLVLAAIIYFVFSPAESAYFPQCPFHRHRDSTVRAAVRNELYIIATL
jgi:hypothetical protein